LVFMVVGGWWALLLGHSDDENHFNKEIVWHPIYDRNDNTIDDAAVTATSDH
jgi:hypothetical protein